MALLCLFFLGGEVPQKFSNFELRAPSAYNHARWKAKILYVLKLALIKPSFVENIDTIRSFTIFYGVLYAKQRLTTCRNGKN